MNFLFPITPVPPQEVQLLYLTNAFLVSFPLISFMIGLSVSKVVDENNENTAAA